MSEVFGTEASVVGQTLIQSLQDSTLPVTPIVHIINVLNAMIDSGRFEEFHDSLDFLLFRSIEYLDAEE